jgi:hypothetical protein
MTRHTSLTLATLVGVLIASGFAAPALAQEQRPGPRYHVEMRGPHHHDGGMANREFRRGGSRGFLVLACSEKGADRIEHMLLTIAQRTDPTAHQQPLFDELKTTALAAQSDFAAACTAARPSEGDAAGIDLPDRMKARLAIEEVRLAAMSEVIPVFEAFYDSLTDEQKAAIEPRRRFEAHGNDKPGRRHGPGMEQERPGDVETPTEG